MKRALGIVGAALLTACSSGPEPPAFPYFEEQGGRVRDQADVLTPDAERRLTAALDRAQATYGPQLAVVTVHSLHGHTIEDFSLSYARAWKLGDANRSDGLLILVAPVEQSVRIEVGTGLEKTFNDPFCKEVIDRVMVPWFRKGNMEAGIVAGAGALVEHMRRYPTLPANDYGPVEQRKVA